MEIHPSLAKIVDFTRESFEKKIETLYEEYVFEFLKYKHYQLPRQNKSRSRHDIEEYGMNVPFNDVSIVFLAGGICRIPYVQKWIKKLFPKAELITKGELEIMTATGAVIHALQVLRGEFEPYIKVVGHKLACAIIQCLDQVKVRTYDSATQLYNEFSHMDKSIHIIISELIEQHGNNLGIVVISKHHDLIPEKSRYFTKEDFEKYGNLVHVATEAELEMKYYLELDVEYSVGDCIMKVENNVITLYRCKKCDERTMTWKEVNRRYFGFNAYIDSKYFSRVFSSKANPINIVYSNRLKKVKTPHVSKLHQYTFKSVNFIKQEDNDPIYLSRFLNYDSEFSFLVNIEKRNQNICIIQNWNFIHVPKLVNQYESRGDIVGIDLGTYKSVIAASENQEIPIIPFDPFFANDLWTESIISFGEGKPIIGKTVAKRMVSHPEYVIFDTKLLWHEYNQQDKLKQLYPFKFSFNENKEPYLELRTSRGIKLFLATDINTIFIEQMIEALNKYKNESNNGSIVKRSVFTVPHYFREKDKSNMWLSSVIEAAKLTDIKIIDIIEETHADLLYYLSRKEYSQMIKAGMKIAIFDIGGGTCACKVYEISEQENKKYGTCIIGSDMFDDKNNTYFGRNIDNIIVKEIEKLVPGEIKNHMKLKILELANKIKHNLSFSDKIG